MHWLVAVALVAGFIFGDPKTTVANWFWSEKNAPWETVDAFYYPDRSNLAKFIHMERLPDVDACRVAVRSVAAQHSDPRVIRGDYICAVGKPMMWMGVFVYRMKVR
jgi:hypothetical protein